MTRTSLATAAAIAAAASLLAVQPSPAQDATDQQLGSVHFATSCNEAAQRRFDRAMRYQHSFWYRASKEIFEEALKADPSCAIAYWGIALSLLYNPHAPPPAENLPLGLAALKKGKEVGAKTPRERDYIDLVRHEVSVRAGKSTLRSFDFLKPKTDLTAPVDACFEFPKGDIEVYDYPDLYLTTDAGERRAGVLLEVIQADHRRITGEGNAAGLACGARFTLERHPRPDRNGDHLV